MEEDLSVRVCHAGLCGLIQTDTCGYYLLFFFFILKAND